MGPDSRGVLDRLIKNPFPTKFIALKGNHELMFETFLRDPSVAGEWRRFGGLETLTSYGVPVSSLMLGRDYGDTAEALKAAVPQPHLEFIAGLRTSFSIGRYFLCHAGVRPGLRWNARARKTSSGFGNRFSAAEPISARSLCTVTHPSKTRSCSLIASTLIPAHT